MMSDSKRVVFAGILIFGVLLLQPYYLGWLGISQDDNGDVALEVISENVPVEFDAPKKEFYKEKKADHDTLIPKQIYNITTPMFSVDIINNSGGSIISSSLFGLDENDNRLLGGFDEYGVYQYDLSVMLAPLDDSYCAPCLSYFDYNKDEYVYFDMPFKLLTPLSSNNINVRAGDNFTIEFIYEDPSISIVKSLVFNSNSYTIDINYTINNNYVDAQSFELYWKGGLRPTESVELEDVTYGYGMVAQGDERVDINLTSADNIISRTIYNGAVNWVAVRNKYFISALIPTTPSSFATLKASNVLFADRKITPAYDMSIGYNNVNNIGSKLFLGPLDIDYINKLNTNLDSSMNFGFSLIRPIGKFVLFVLKFMHNSLKLNYGIALILFAFIVWFVTKPLTKKSFESSKKMQQVAPLIKKVQEKYKDNPQKMNQEVMRLYKENGANPLGGCLPMLLQMPLLWALFVVFRSTIEFRGAGFILWINDLSQPDILFHLPFHIPIYGSHIAVLPILMGISIFMTQRLSMATMDPNQKPIMYIMNGFFILIFNSFPSGLNLYYTVYNLLNYFQQKSINIPTKPIK